MRTDVASFEKQSQCGGACWGKLLKKQTKTDALSRSVSLYHYLWLPPSLFFCAVFSVSLSGVLIRGHLKEIHIKLKLSPIIALTWPHIKCAQQDKEAAKEEVKEGQREGDNHNQYWQFEWQFHSAFSSVQFSWVCLPHPPTLPQLGRAPFVYEANKNAYQMRHKAKCCSRP